MNKNLLKGVHQRHTANRGHLCKTDEQSEHTTRALLERLEHESGLAQCNQRDVREERVVAHSFEHSFARVAS